MNTFLPYPSFEESAKVLDNKRLGKQRVEVYQILKCLLEEKTRWYNHPAVQMWKGYENLLIEYGLAICREWIKRGYKDTCFQKISIFKTNLENLENLKLSKPDWLGKKEFHKAYKSNLFRKNKEYYSKYNWNVPDNLPYLWPTKI